MTLAALAQALGLTGLFASRVFVPLFAAALVMRFGPDLPLIGALGLLDGLGGAPPTWFTSNTTLVVLGVLSAAELLAHKSPEARELLNAVDQYAKPVAAFAALLGIASVTDQEFVDGVFAHAGFTDAALGLFVAGGTFLVASAHNLIVADISEIDEDDDTGLLGLLSWGQDLYAFFGVVFLILFPVVMAVLIAATIGVVFLLRRRAEKVEERSKIACPGCQQPMYRSALVCANCGRANPSPTRVNWLGVSTNQPAADLDAQPYLLATKRRCRRCAARLPERDPRQPCPACGAQPFDDPAFVAEYDRLVTARIPGVLLVCVGLSMVPVIGLIPGVIYYRLAIVAPYRRYLGRARTFFLRWVVRLVCLLLIVIQWMPVIGGLTVPAMAMLNYAVYRRVFFGRVGEGNVSGEPAARAAAAVTE